MAHVVENGTGLSTANAYLSATDADTYFTDHGAPAGWTGSTPAKEQAIRMATQYLDAEYGGRWRGVRLKQDQALDWPRFGGEDDDGFAIASDSLPQALKDACAEAALDSLAGADLLPDIDEPGVIQSESVQVGPVSSSTTYMGGKSQVVYRRKIALLLAPLVESGDRLVRG